MNQINLHDFSLPELKNIAQTAGISTASKTREDIVADLKKAFKIVVDRRTKYTEMGPLGYKGKEGTVVEVRDKAGNHYAMKKFRSGKSSSRLEHEAKLLGMAGDAGIAPRLIDYSRSGEWIVMEKMDRNLFDILKSTNGIISKAAQQDMLDLFKKLDRVGIFHADPNPLNFMYKDGRMYLIDYGFAKTFDEPSVVALQTATPNMDYMPIGFLVKIKDKCDVRNFPVLLKALSRTNLHQLGL